MRRNRRLLLAIFFLLVFAGMLVYGGLIQSVEVSQKALKGIELVSKASSDVLSIVDGRIVEKVPEGGEAAPRCPT